MNTITKIENNRAAFAFQAVKKAVAENDYSKVRTVIKKMPTMIQVNGLGQTLAFYFSKRQKEKEHKVVYDIINRWLVEENTLSLFEHTSGDDELVERIINLQSKEYKAATAEAIALLNWMRRFVEGMDPSK